VLTGRRNPVPERSHPFQGGSGRGDRDFIGVPCYVRGLCLPGLWTLGCSFPPTIWVTSLGSSGKGKCFGAIRVSPTIPGSPARSVPPSCPQRADGVHKSG